MTANAIGVRLPARRDQDRGIMAHLSVSVAAAEIVNPLGLRVVAGYYESW